jgi:hypothetical protein
MIIRYLSSKLENEIRDGNKVSLLFGARQVGKNQDALTSLYFWRTRTGAEVDLVEEREGKLFAFAYKWSKPRLRPPQSFLDTYPGATFAVITPENCLTHVGARV